MVTRKLIELEAKRDAYEYARQIVDAVLNQEMHKIANLIKQEKDNISERYALEQSISEEVKQS